MNNAGDAQPELVQHPELVSNLVNAVLETVQARSAPPVSTYRLQLHAGFDFYAAAAVVPYLKELGVTHVYASPYLQAQHGSTHGYDVVDYGRVNEELGGPAGHQALVDALTEHGMSHILDMVPNHTGVVPDENLWWRDVLENGPSSPYSEYFDIDWSPNKDELRNKVLLPILGDQYGQVLESGHIKLEFVKGSFVLRYWEKSLPIEPSTAELVLRFRIDELRQRLGDDSEEMLEYESITNSLEYLPDRSEVDPQRVHERQREKQVIRRRLETLASQSAEVLAFIQENVDQFNGTAGDPRSFDRLDELIAKQVYRLAHWRTASDEINYRRFFDINDLAALCVEQPSVFEDAHRLPLDFAARGLLTGLRIDHIDGLYDPEQYLWRLQWAYLREVAHRIFDDQHASEVAAMAGVAAGEVAGEGVSAESGIAGEGDSTADVSWDELEAPVLLQLWQRLGGVRPDVVLELPMPQIETLARESAVEEAAPSADAETATAVYDAAITNGHDEESQRRSLADGLAETADTSRQVAWKLPPLYVLVEKILGAQEPLPARWAVAGTTGYEFLNALSGALVYDVGLQELTKLYGRFTGETVRLKDVIYRAKRLILDTSMSSELHMLAHRFNRISEQHRSSRDFTFNALRRALREILADFDIYRTYITDAEISQRDRRFLLEAVATAKARTAAEDVSVFDFIRDTLLYHWPEGLPPEDQRDRGFFVGRFQQVTSPVMAKGVEDTAFYIHFPLASLNEVGSEHAHGLKSLKDFHDENLDRVAKHPASMTCSTTHDTKRTEDVRARIHVLSEIPQVWRSILNRWARMNRRHVQDINGWSAPSRNDQYLFFQTLIGMWPCADPDEAGHAEVVARLQQYMEKATREAKQHTSWINPNEPYDAAVRKYVAGVLEYSPKNRFLTALREFRDKIIRWGLYTAMSQTLLRLASPGVPDVYQGQELWDFSLVDPDNRRPVDYDRRRWLLAEVQHEASNPESLLEFARSLASNPFDDRVKMLITWTVLQFRRRHVEFFKAARYVPLKSTGPHAEHVCAFAWILDDEHQAEVPEDAPRAVLVVAPRWIARLTAGDEELSPAPLGADHWQDTRLQLPDFPNGHCRNLFTGQTLDWNDGSLLLADLLSDLSVAFCEVPRG